MTIATPATSTLRSPWLGITRLAWILAAVTAFALSALGIIKSWSEPLPQCTTAEAVCGPWIVSLEDIATASQAGLPADWILVLYHFGFLFPKLVFGAVGLLIFWKRSEDWVAQLLSLMLVLFSLEGVTNLGPLQPLADIMYSLSAFIFCILPFIFPNGRFVPRWIGWLAFPIAILATSSTIAPSLGITLTETSYTLLILVPYVAYFILAAYSVVLRFRVDSTPTERQQTKWAFAGILGSFILIIPFVLISVFFPPSQPSVERILFILLVHYPIYMLSYLLIPGGVAFAILRYRLWDIDILIRRTLQYAVLTGLLALVYFGGVVVLQSLLAPITGQENSPFVIVLSTLGIAALFNPLRRRVQELIDRLFYRKKYVAEQAQAAFAAAIRDEVDIDLLTGALLEVVDETIQPATSRLWLKNRE